MKKTLIISVALAVLLNLWQYAKAAQERSQASVITPSWQTSASRTSPAPARSATVLNASTTTVGQTVTESGPAPVPADPAAVAATRLTQAHLQPEFAALYLRVQAATGTPWQLLAAVHQVETGQSGDTARTSYAGAQGPMQFMPATFRAYAKDGDGNGTATITDLEDAMMTAGRYLAAGGADKGSYNTALYNYNHSYVYVNKVLGIAHTLGL
jgi:membrane-bound lytic murein transglycosylase B